MIHKCLITVWDQNDPPVFAREIKIPFVPRKGFVFSGLDVGHQFRFTIEDVTWDCENSRFDIDIETPWAPAHEGHKNAEATLRLLGDPWTLFDSWVPYGEKYNIRTNERLSDPETGVEP